jgi:hypothetical protein
MLTAMIAVAFVAATVEMLNTDQQCLVLRRAQRLTDAQPRRAVADAAGRYGRQLQGASHEMCVRVPLLFHPTLGGPHWFHHAFEPAGVTASLLHSPAIRPHLQNRSLLVVAPARLILNIKTSRMVKLLFETILTRGAFHISGYATEESNRAQAMDCVVSKARMAKLGGTNVWNELDGKHAAVGKAIAGSRPAFHDKCGTYAPQPHADERMVHLYQRDHNRMFSNVNEVLQVLRRTYGSSRVSMVSHDEQRDPCETVRIVGRSQVWVSMHGFNSVLGFLLSEGSLWLELYPDFVRNTPHYWSVAQRTGVTALRYAEPAIAPRALSQPLSWWIVRGFKQLPSCVTEDVGFARWRPLVQFLAMMKRTGVRRQNMALNTTTMHLLVAAHARQLQGEHCAFDDAVQLVWPSTPLSAPQLSAPSRRCKPDEFGIGRRVSTWAKTTNPEATMHAGAARIHAFPKE